MGLALCIQRLLLAKWTFMPASEQGLSLFALSIIMDISQMKFRNMQDCLSKMPIKKSSGGLKKKEKSSIRDTCHHRYPFCWRSDTPLIYKAVSTWFVAVEKIKDKCSTANEQDPLDSRHFKYGRFGNGWKVPAIGQSAATAIGERLFLFGAQKMGSFMSSAASRNWKS